jgi:hypothetical protein
MSKPENILETISVRDVRESDLASLRDLYRTVWRATYERTLGPAAVNILINGLEKSDLKHLLPSEADAPGSPSLAAFLSEPRLSLRRTGLAIYGECMLNRLGSVEALGPRCFAL